MVEPVKIMEGLWSFPIVLPRNPLKWLNCYVIKDDNGGRNLLIDTGFNLPECRATLFEGMEALGLNKDNTDILITHYHADHVGNALHLDEMGFRLMMGRTDYAIHSNSFGGKNQQSAGRKRMPQEGVNPEVMAEITKNPAFLLNSPPFTASMLFDGDHLKYGDFDLECVVTPGHTLGHMSLYNAERKLLFSGDNVLFDITPNICAWAVGTDMLGHYFESLDRISKLDVEIVLPSHRNTGDKTMEGRIAELKAHHAERLAEVMSVIEASGEVTAYQIASRLTWHITTRSWDGFPSSQKWFAISEALAHIDHLVKLGKVNKSFDSDGTAYYSIKA